MSGYSIPSFVMAGIGFYIAITHFIYFSILPKRNKRLYLLFALMGLGTSFYDILQGQIYLAVKPEQGITFQLIQFIAICPISIIIFLLIFEFIKKKLGFWSKLQLTFLSILSVLSIVFHNFIMKSRTVGFTKEVKLPYFEPTIIHEGDPSYFGILIIFAGQLTFLMTFVIVTLEYRKTYKTKKNRRIGYLLFSQVVFIVAIINDTLVALNFTSTVTLLEYCFLFLIITTVFATSEEVIKISILQDEKDNLHAQLIESQKNESLGRLASGIAHDFNNLLVPIVCISEMIQYDLKKTDPLFDDIKQISEAGAQAQQLTKQLLAYSRKQPLNVEIFDLRSYIMEVEPFLNRVLRENIALSFNPAQNCTISFDKSKLHQILMNLVVNSTYAMPKGGIIHFKLSKKTNLFTDTENCKSSSSAIILSIHDTGPGIDKEIASQIFDPFFTTKSLDEGTGLGLSTVFGIVKQHNGEIRLIDTNRSGAKFEISLPYVDFSSEPDLSKIKVQETPTVRVEKSHLFGEELILVVEDEKKVREVIKRVLEPLGFKLVIAPDAESALKIFEEMGDHITLLLSDIVLPGISGWELYNQLRSARDDLNVLFMSGYTASVGSGEQLLPLGVDYLQKPFTADMLCQAILNKIDPQPDA